MNKACTDIGMFEASSIPLIGSGLEKTPPTRRWPGQKKYGRLCGVKILPVPTFSPTFTGMQLSLSAAVATTFSFHHDYFLRFLEMCVSQKAKVLHKRRTRQPRVIGSLAPRNLLHLPPRVYDAQALLSCGELPHDPCPKQQRCCV